MAKFLLLEGGGAGGSIGGWLLLGEYGGEEIG
jgi:hypothetical protein